MAEEQKGLTAKKVRELYLYPYRSKGENALRGVTWMVSWIVGIVLQPTVDQKTLGGAYLIFAVSLLLEFIPESKEWRPAKFIHAFFCILLVVMLLGAFFLILAAEPNSVTSQHWIYQKLAVAPDFVGQIFFYMLLIDVIFILCDVDKLFYDEDAEAERGNEAAREAVHNQSREQFMDNLIGTKKGGDTQ